MKLRIKDITWETMADGPGIRNVVWVQGCAHHCPGCHNPQTWDFESGTEVDIEELAARLASNSCDLTLSGGDPMYQPRACTELCARIRELIPGINIWCWTGFTLEECQSDPERQKLLDQLDVLVDGPYIKELPPADWVGSNNQRVIHLR